MSCALIMLPADKYWFWHCRTHDTQGEPADIITAYWGGLVHEKERENND